MNSRVILHSDCDSFYASVACLNKPELNGKPVAVGGDSESRNGIILSKNPLAKTFGVKTAEPLWQARQKCPELVVIRPDYDLYHKFAKKIRQIYFDYTDRIEPFGLDEAWLDVTGSQMLFGDGMSIAREISSRVKEETNITVSIGVSFNKVFSKLGSDYRKPYGITEISQSNFKRIVWPLPANHLLFVGGSTYNSLKKLGIYTIGDVANTPLNILKSNFGKGGVTLYNYANGFDTSSVAFFEHAESIPKSISNSATTPRDLVNDRDVKITMHLLADSVARRMRDLNLRCSTISMHVRNSKLSVLNRQHTMPRPVCSTKEIFDCAYQLFCENFHWNNTIRSLGIALSGFNTENTGVQMCLFETDEKKIIRHEKLDCAVDKIKDKYGSKIINSALTFSDKRLCGIRTSSHNPFH